MIPSNSIIYVQGLLRMAASYSRGMAPSVIQAQGFDRKQYAAQFARKYEIPEETVKPSPTEDTMRELLNRWITGGKGRRGDRVIARWVERLIRHRLGAPMTLMSLRWRTPVSLRKRMAAEAEPPVASIGSTTITSRS